jgi:hypothetical protein
MLPPIDLPLLWYYSIVDIAGNVPFFNSLKASDHGDAAR